MSRRRATLTLKDRLRRFGIAPAAEGAVTPEAVVRPRPAAPDPGEVPGEVVSCDGESFVLNTLRLPFTHRHGDQTLGEALAMTPGLAGLAGRDPAYRSVAPDKRLYLDTETSSLHSGAGVFVFLVGVASIEEEEVVIRQFFMRHPGEERALFRHFDAFLPRFEALVSFHGKSFDCPRLRDRLLFQNLPDALPRRAHLDLLHAARQLYRHRHPSCRLQILERAELGFHREDDLPGAECPEAWFAYLRGEENRIARIMEHNRDDLLSLITLEARLAALIQGPEDPFQALATGLLAAEAGEGDRARPLLVAAVEGLAPLPSAMELSTARALRVAASLRRLGEKDVARTWLERLHEERPAEPRIATALAIALERDHGDREAAGAVVDRTLSCLATEDSTLLRRQQRLGRYRALRKSSFIGRP